jgi:hypothetical protein
MSRTLTVKDLIKELLKFDMDETVFIALGNNILRPAGSSSLSHVSPHDANTTCGLGVYLHPNETLVDSDA